MMKGAEKRLLFVFLIVLFISGCFFGETPKEDNAGNNPSEEIPVALPTPDDIDGFFVKDGKLYDANGFVFQMKGVNANHWWNASGRDNESLYYDSIPYMKAAGANTVRIVFGPDPDGFNPWADQCPDTASRRAVVEEYIKYRIVPVVEYHNATGYTDPLAVEKAVDFWKGEKEWLDDLSRYVILNITNEWGKRYPGEDGHAAITHEIWANTYKSAITEIRKAGITNLIMIDSFDYGHSLKCVLDYGEEIIEHDSMHNVLFSIHAYGGWYSSKTNGVRNIEEQVPGEGFVLNWSADHALKFLAEKKLPVIIGEFSYNCTKDLNGDCAPDDELIDDFNANETGWLFWMWWNWNNGARVQMMNQSDSFSYTESGKVIADYLKDSKEATIFSEDPPVPVLPSLGEPDPDYNPGNPSINGLIDNAPDLIEVRFERGILDADASLVPDHMEMEIQNNGAGDTSFYWLVFRGWKWCYGTRELQPDEFMGKTVRFWIYTPEGSVARTVWGTFEHNKEFAIDTSY